MRNLLVCLVGLLALVPSSNAGSCGGRDQRPCKLWERVPSCDAGLVEDFARGRCVAPAPPRPPPPARPPACGAADQRPCNLWERVPSCDAGLVEDFLVHRCLPPGQASLAQAEQVALEFQKRHEPALQLLVAFARDLGEAGSRKYFDSGQFRRELEAGQLEEIGRRLALPRLQAAVQKLGEPLLGTLTIGIAVEGGVGLGASVESGIALPLKPGGRALAYRTLGLSLGLITGGSGALSVGLCRGTPEAIGGEGRGLSVGLGKSIFQGVSAGGALAFWFRPQAGSVGALAPDLAAVQGVGLAVGVGATILPVDLRGTSVLTQVSRDLKSWWADACGRDRLRPCHVVERVPSCDPGLREDFLQHRCVR